MNIRVDVDLTPVELRKLLGMPDVEAFNQELMDKMLEKLRLGVEGYDPLELFNNYAKTANVGMDIFKAWMNMVSNSVPNTEKSGKSD